MKNILLKKTIASRELSNSIVFDKTGHNSSVLNQSTLNDSCRQSRVILAVSFLSLFLVLVSGCSSIDNSDQKMEAIKSFSPQDKGWKIVWSDEFNSQQLDQNKWSYEINCWGGGNNEKQCYTERPVNSFIANGILNIVALKEEFTGSIERQDAKKFDLNVTQTLPFTSARIRTKGKGDWLYGRFEIRAKLPKGQGSWPAIWMMPTDSVYGEWSASGEIDIMEAINLGTPSDLKSAPSGTIENRVYGTLHYGNQKPNNVYSGTWYSLDKEQNPSEGFHTYAIEWEEGEIRWYVDNYHYATQQQSGWYSSGKVDSNQSNLASDNAPFDQPFHLIINQAVGGEWPIKMNLKGIDHSVYPQTLQIDYVRVYQCEKSIGNGKGCASKNDAAQLVKGHQPPAKKL